MTRPAPMGREAAGTTAYGLTHQVELEAGQSLLVLGAGGGAGAGSRGGDLLIDLVGGEALWDLAPAAVALAAVEGGHAHGKVVILP